MFRSKTFFNPDKKDSKEGFTIFEINDASNKITISLFDRKSYAKPKYIKTNEFTVGFYDFFLGNLTIPLG